MVATPAPHTGALEAPRRRMKRSLVSAEIPQVDQGNVGLNLVNVVYGVVLAGVFIPTSIDYRNVPAAQWSQLILAATAIVLSWIGYYNNRGEYKVWRARFLNIPFFQYLISVLILAGYWGLILSAEGFQSETGTTSALPEALIMLTVFALYFLWDILEFCVQSSEKYVAVMTRVYTEEREKQSQGTVLYSPDDLKKRTRARGVVTLIFVGFLIGVVLVFWQTNPDSTRLVVAIDGLGVLMLLVYRILQERAVSAAAPGLEPKCDSA
jgi:hypothetical protein